MKFKNRSRFSVVAVLFGVLALTGCKEEALEKVPATRISPGTVFANTENAYAAIEGMHKGMYSQWYGVQAEGGQSGNMIYMEVLGDDFVMTAQANGWFVSEYRWLGHRNFNANIVRFNYAFYYNFIGNANQIIAQIDNAAGPQSDKNNLKAQALTYRAWSYYQMVQLYGKRYVKGGDNSSLGMSLVLEPIAEAVPRSTVEETYTQINKDLDEAISLFASASPRKDKSHLSVEVAKGIKARVALTQQNYAVAAQFAKEARGNVKPMTQAQVMGGFSDYTNPEWLWGIRHRDDQTTFFYGFFAYVGNFSSTNTRGNPKAINSKLYAKISPTDIRKQLWDSTGSMPGFPVAAAGVRMPYMNRKFLLANPGNSNGDLAFMRAAEMYLIEAEALARDGKEADAVNVLFELASARDTQYVKSTKTGDALIDEILTQRRVELWGEGFRFYDLKRLNLPLDREGANHPTTLAQKLTEPAGTINWEFLIPQGEIDRTQGIVVQNPM